MHSLNKTFFMKLVPKSVLLLKKKACLIRPSCKHFIKLFYYMLALKVPLH